MMRSTKPEDRAVMEKVGVLFPNQESFGTHVNIAGGAVARYSRHLPAAQAFLEYLASPKAQIYFANGNNEYPAVGSVVADNPALKTLGTFKAEVIPVSVVGANSAKVQQLLDRAGFK
jgi:iron(III) transport system substrate-binding protein